jgi:hypothetical protein
MHGSLCLDRGAKELIFSLWEAIPQKAMILLVLEFLALVKNEVTALYPETVISHSPAIRGLDKKLTHFILLATRAWRLIAKLEKTLRFARPEKIK